MTLLCAYAAALFWISRIAGKASAGSKEGAGCAFFVNSRLLIGGLLLLLAGLSGQNPEWLSEVARLGIGGMREDSV